MYIILLSTLLNYLLTDSIHADSSPNNMKSPLFDNFTYFYALCSYYLYVKNLIKISRNVDVLGILHLEGGVTQIDFKVVFR